MQHPALPKVSQILTKNVKLEVFLEHPRFRAVHGPPFLLGVLALRREAVRVVT